MPQKSNYTINEHFVPQFYLKFFSPDNAKIYQYKIKSRHPSKLVPIETICCEKDLYELKNDNNEFICRNLIENILGRFEGEFANVINSIVSKSRHEENYQIPCFLSTDEKMFLVIFVATSILRNPHMLKTATECVVDHVQGRSRKVSSNTAFNTALLTCLPFDEEIGEESDNLLSRIIDKLLKMGFLIGVTSADRLYTSDNPIFFRGNVETFEIDEVVFPLTSNIVLFMYPINQLPIMKRNMAIHLTDKDVKDVNYKTILFCREWLYCKKTIKSRQINIIERLKEN